MRLPCRLSGLSFLLLLSFAIATGATGAGFITSAEVASGTFVAPIYSETWTFNGAAGDRVLIAAVTTSGAANTLIRLRDPGNVEVIATANDRVDYQLLSTGTYTLIVEDAGLNDGGTYNLSLLNVTAGPLANGADPDGGPVTSAQVWTGTTDAVCDFDGFTFSGTAGDRILCTALATTGSPYNTTIWLYPPGGGAPETTTGGGDRLDHTLGTSGLYTVVIEDAGNDHAGSYAVTFLNVTVGPFTYFDEDVDGAYLIGGESISGTIAPAPDFDGFRFTGAAGDTVEVSAVTTSGPINTTISIYPPSGPPVVQTANDNVTYVLTASGSYTVVIEDSGLDQTGTYSFTYNGPGDPAGIPEKEPFDRANLVVLSPYPSPFARSAALSFSLPHDLSVRVQVFDAGGALVRTLADGARPAGRHRVEWDGRDDRGRLTASGIYYLQAVAGGEISRHKLVRVE